MPDNVGAGLPNRGKTYHAGTPTSIGRSVELEGTEVKFRDDVKSGSGPTSLRSGRFTTCKLVRNVSGFALAPKRLVSWAAGYRGTRVDGYVAATAGEVAGVVDDRLPVAGAADDDLFYIMVKGPGLCVNDLGTGASAISDGAFLVALTAVTTGAVTAGRIASGNAATLGHIQNSIGRAMSATTSANTGANVLVDLQII
jgi:hypothetical protein